MADELRAGTQIGQYTLLFQLGKGGMGEVWAGARRVSELGFQRLVAIKILHTRQFLSNQALMFLDEAKAASVLEHAGIVNTFDLGREDNLLYIAMDLVQGPSLTAMLQRLALKERRMGPALVGYIGRQLAAALDYAHERATFKGKQLRLIHRDISPHNVLIDMAGTIRLSDFGIARTAIQQHESHVGTVRGKPSYMAPEQVLGGDIDARTDIFALGIVLYECGGLVRLFGRSNPVKSMEAVRNHTPRPLTEIVPDFPPALWRVIEKALEKKPDSRFQSAAEMVEALGQVLRKLPGGSTPAPDLVALISESFEPGAFDLDARVKTALAEAEAYKEVAAATQGRTAAGRPSSNPGASPMITPAVQTGAWPATSSPEPLSPEALAEAQANLTASARGLPPLRAPPGMTSGSPVPLMHPSESRSQGTGLPYQTGSNSMNALPLQLTDPGQRWTRGMLLTGLVGLSSLIVGIAGTLFLVGNQPQRKVMLPKLPVTENLVASQPATPQVFPNSTQMRSRGEEPSSATPPADPREGPRHKPVGRGRNGGSEASGGSARPDHPEHVATGPAAPAPAPQGQEPAQATQEEIGAVFGLIKKVQASGTHADEVTAMMNAWNQAAALKDGATLRKLRARANALLDH